jgi:glycosyltransferase involved in cell wall biosynthesis
MAKNIVRFNPWISAAIVSGPVLGEVFGNHPDLLENFDLVHFLDQYSSKEWLPRFLPSTPVVTTHHHVADWELDRHNMDGDAIVVVAREWEDDLRDRGIPMGNVVRYSNGVDAVKFAPPTEQERSGMRSDLGVPSGNVLVGFFAKRGSNNHNDRKGTDVLAEAVVSLAGRIGNLSLLIVGPGWETYVTDLRQRGVHCIWKPFVKDNESMRRMYHALDFYWVTSRVEGGPVPLLEAMSCGACCVTTPVGLVPEIGIDRENLLLVPFDDPDAVAMATAD